MGTGICTGAEGQVTLCKRRSGRGEYLEVMLCCLVCRVSSEPRGSAIGESIH